MKLETIFCCNNELIRFWGEIAMYEAYLNNKFTNGLIMFILFFIIIAIAPFLFFINFIFTIRSALRPSQNMTGKVVLITGASSGIGECLAYEYAKKGANLVIVARREGRLQQVAERARGLGSPDVVVVCADVSNLDDCKRFVDQTIGHFGRLDHLVNNAGIACIYTSEMDVSKFRSVMDINFWGAIYPTYFAIPHLKTSKGNIVVNSSAAAILHHPESGFYAASKAALVGYYESLKVELGSTIKITIVTLGYIESDMIKGSRSTKEDVKSRYKNSISKAFPVMGTEPCARSIVDGVCRGERYITEPKFVRVLFLVKFFFPRVIEWHFRNVYLPKLGSLDRDDSVNVAKAD